MPLRGGTASLHLLNCTKTIEKFKRQETWSARQWRSQPDNLVMLYANRAFSLNFSIRIRAFQLNKEYSLFKNTILFPMDWFGTPIWPPFLCFGTPTWSP